MGRFIALVALGVGACGPSAGSSSCPNGEDSCAAPACESGATADCYNGPAGTDGVGACAGGVTTCDSDGEWGPCVGEVTPANEQCANAVDDNCDGEVDEERDIDGDGFSTCQADCCDEPGLACGDPALVNPGAFEVPGNEVDDDCDGTVDNALPACDDALASSSSLGLDYAAAIDLCQTALENSPTEERRWGVITAALIQASGSGMPAPNSRSIRPGYGAGITPRAGTALAALSTGHAAAQNDVAPAYAAPQLGQSMGTTGSAPSDWLAANGNVFPNAPGCPAAGSADANDSVMLRLRVRVPTNANSFSMSVNFLSSEYPEYVCSAFNDFFVVLLDSTFAGQPANPADKNLAIYTAPDNSQYPVGVNLAYGDTGLFRQCKNGPTGCTSVSVAGTTNACAGTGELTGTGHDVLQPAGFLTEPGYCGISDLAGGGTGWLVTSGNVVPGEIMDLRIAIWDTTDDIYDSTVLVDNFVWSVDASEPGTDIPVD